MTAQNRFKFKIATAIRLLLLVGIRRLRTTWDSHTVEESLQGNATPLEAAAFLTLQNLPLIKKRKNFDTKLRKYIKNGKIRRGVLANGYPEPESLQANLFDHESTQNAQVSTTDMVSLIEEVNSIDADLMRHNLETDLDEDEIEYDDRPLFLYGLLTGGALVSLIPLWTWLGPQIHHLPMIQKQQYSPQVIQVAAARGQDCARSEDLYSQLFCGELWRKELSARVEQNYIDLLAVSTAIDSMHKNTGFEVAEPLAKRIRSTQSAWRAHLEQSCNTAAAVENLGAKRGNRYLDCVHTQLIARESEIRTQLNYLRGLGWQEQADDVLNNELIAIRNLEASTPGHHAEKAETTEEVVMTQDAELEAPAP